MATHLLVVDDNPTNLKLAADVLESAGYEVERAASAEQALAAIARAMPALILLDLALPGIDGLTLARTLKSDEATRRIPIVAMTAYAMRGDEQKARAAGCDGYIAKPIDTRRLPEQIGDMLAPRASRVPRNVLIADDLETSRKLLRVTLEAEGLRVFEAADGVEALALLEREPIDAIIADILMPNMDGFGLCYEVRSSERWFKLPFIVYTNTYTSPADEQVAFDLGADCYLRKPATVRAIVDALLRAARSASGRQRSRIEPPEDVHLLKSYSGRLIDKLEQRNAELARKGEALAEANRVFEELVSHLPEVFWMSSFDRGEIVYVSPAYETVFGRSRESLRERPLSWFDAVHPDDAPRVVRNPQSTVSGEYDQEYRIVRADGAVRWIRDRAFSIDDPSGRPHRLAGLAEDVTERKLAEETAASLELQLHQTQRLEALGTLAGGIAHDFNNILTAILANAQLLQIRLPKDDPVQENTSEILYAAQRASDLVRQILTFSRRQEQAREPVQLQPVVEEALKLLRATLPASIEIRTDLAADVPAVTANASQLHQVLVNLCSNAAHAMADRGGRIDIGLAEVVIDQDLARAHPELSEGQRCVCLSVADTGHGMDRATLSRIFEPFFTTKMPSEGTGLGLSVVHGIVQAHGGAIAVDSELGRGTTFRIYLPAAPAPSVRAVSASDVPRGRGERLAFVDDERAILRLAVNSLEQLGYRVTTFASPDEVLAAFRERPHDFDLVLTDLSMPHMSGVDLARRLLALRPDLPIVMSTGYAKALEAAHAQRLGIRELLMKPFTLESLAQTVRRALEPPAPPPKA